MNRQELLAAIAPGPGDRAKYSPNLHTFMRRRDTSKHEDFRFTAWIADREHLGGSKDVIYLGYMFDKEFTGAPLQYVLRGRASLGCYPSMGPHNTKPLPGFWEGYIAQGRCHIDPDHSWHFVDNRWQLLAENHRKCLWCGHEQRREEREYMKTYHVWIGENEPQDLQA